MAATLDPGRDAVLFRGWHIMRFAFRSLFRRLTSVWALAGAVAVCSPAVAQSQSAAQERRDAIEEINTLMIASLEAKNFVRARNLCEQLILWQPQNPVHHYNLACIEAQAGGPRLAHALGALELSVALGFNEAEHMQADPDLIPLHSNPRFPDLVRKVMQNAIGNDALSAITIPPPSSRPVESEGSGDQPAPAAIVRGLPVGLYHMSRYHSGDRTVEQGVWYFAPDGTVYRNLGSGFALADLATDSAAHGRAALAGNRLEISWQGGEKQSADLDREDPDFTWGMALFTPITAFADVRDAAGVYQGPEAGTKLELRSDGSYLLTGLELQTAAGSTGLTVAAGKTNQGKWELKDFSLTLVDQGGGRLRRFAFPSDDDKTVLKPDRMFFGGTMYRKLP